MIDDHSGGRARIDQIDGWSRRLRTGNCPRTTGIYRSPPARGQAWANRMVAGEVALAAGDDTKRRAEAIADPLILDPLPQKVPDNVRFSK